MTQVGEAVGVGEFVSDTHTKSTCPWHQEGKKDKKKMDAPDPDEDTEAMPPNDGGALGRNLKAARDKPPKADSLWVGYKWKEELRYKAGRKMKVVQVYKETKGDDEEEYDLQYAPHHLIPGNESLKGSKVVPFMGDADSISEYAEGQSSVIKEGFSINYDVNGAKNGVWLPSPYALSMKNEWPAEPAIKVIKRRLGQKRADESEDFKTAYVAASIEASGGRQFHMRHKPYSDQVREILKTIGSRMKLMAKGECPIAADSKESGKFDPPMGLVGRLNALSANMHRFLTGSIWRPPLFTDAMTEEYSKDLKWTERKGGISKVM